DTWSDGSAYCPKAKCRYYIRAGTRRSGWRCAIWLTKDNRHVAEVAPDGLKRRLADPVLASKLGIIDPNRGGRHATQRDRVLGKRVPDATSVPGRPGSQPRTAPARLDPDFDRVVGGQLGVDRCGRKSLAAVRVGQPVRARNRQDHRVVHAVTRQGRLTAI